MRNKILQKRGNKMGLSVREIVSNVRNSRAKNNLIAPIHP